MAWAVLRRWGYQLLEIVRFQVDLGEDRSVDVCVSCLYILSGRCRSCPDEYPMCSSEYSWRGAINQISSGSP